MRKDVKIGLAIGGVLLAVLIVYLLVPKDAGKSEQYGQADLSNTSPENNPANTGGSEADSAAATDGAYREGARSSDQSPSTGSEGSATTTDTSNAGGNTGVSTEGDSPTEAPARRFDWNAMLSQGVMPDKPELMAVPPTTGGGQATGPPGQAPQNDPFAKDPEPNWNEGAVSQGSAGTRGQASSAVTQAPPQQPTTPSSTGGVREHTVQPGETLSSIALATYGESRHYLAIERANPDLDPKRMRPGMKIKLPDPAAVKAEASARAAAPARQTAQQQATIDPAREYRVQPGDSLYKISLRLYGRGDKADALYQANRAAIGDDSARLKVGTVIKLPEAPTASPTATR